MRSLPASGVPSRPLHPVTCTPAAAFRSSTLACPAIRPWLGSSDHASACLSGQYATVRSDALFSTPVHTCPASAVHSSTASSATLQCVAFRPVRYVLLRYGVFPSSLSRPGLFRPVGSGPWPSGLCSAVLGEADLSVPAGPMPSAARHAFPLPFQAVQYAAVRRSAIPSAAGPAVPAATLLLRLLHEGTRREALIKIVDGRDEGREDLTQRDIGLQSGSHPPQFLHLASHDLLGPVRVAERPFR